MAPRVPPPTPWRLLLVGWSIHASVMLLVGAYQQDYRDLFNLFINEPLMWQVHAWRSNVLDQVMVAVSSLGKGNVVAVAFVALLVILRGPTWRRARIHISAILLGAALLTALGKFIVQTARPSLWPALESAAGSSFPSSHASASLSLAWALWILTPSRWRLTGGFALFVAAAAVGGSRVYLGVHAPTDILLTWLLVGSWAVWTQGMVVVNLRAAKPIAADPL